MAENLGYKLSDLKLEDKFAYKMQLFPSKGDKNKLDWWEYKSVQSITIYLQKKDKHLTINHLTPKILNLASYL